MAILAFEHTATEFQVADIVAGGYDIHTFNSQADFQAWSRQELAAGRRHNCKPRQYAKGRQYDCKDHRFEYFPQ